MRLLFCGVRGSTPAPGPAFVRYGGNTSCVAVMADEDDAPRLILDAGTGLGRLSDRLNGAPFRGAILLGHLHWDHTHGLPFFPAGARDDSEVHLFIPAQGDVLGVLERAVSPPHFPVTPSELGGRWAFTGVEEGRRCVEGFEVLAREIPHKGGRTFGYRVSQGGHSIAYLSDHSPLAYGPGPEGLGAYHEAAMELAAGVDLLIHDAQHTAEELPSVASFGHSAIEYAVGLAAAAGSRELMLFHHAPSRTDDEIDRIVAELSGGPGPVRAAAEGTEVAL